MAITAIGIVGYIVIEGWSFLDSLYMTVLTITTVGYDEVHPLTSNGRIFSLFLMAGGVGGSLICLRWNYRVYYRGSLWYYIREATDEGQDC